MEDQSSGLGDHGRYPLLENHWNMRFTIRTALLATLFVAIGTAWWLDSTRKGDEIQKQQEILDQRNWHSWQRYMALADSTSLEHALMEQQETYGNLVRKTFENPDPAGNSMANMFDEQLEILSQEIETCSLMLSQYKNRPGSTQEQAAIKKQIARMRSSRLRRERTKG